MDDHIPDPFSKAPGMEGYVITDENNNRLTSTYWWTGASGNIFPAYEVRAILRMSEGWLIKPASIQPAKYGTEGEVILLGEQVSIFDPKRVGDMARKQPVMANNTIKENENAEDGQTDGGAQKTQP